VRVRGEGQETELRQSDLKLLDGSGTPGWIRTNDSRIRSPVLYPAELRVHPLEFVDV
jgi:hypothetical protein